MAECEKVIFFDGMEVVQSMKKNPSMKKIIDLAAQFVKRIRRLMKGYTEGRVLFDQYLGQSLKTNTRKKRGDSDNSPTFHIHSDMKIVKLSLKELLASSRTKTELTEYLSLYLIQNFSTDEKNLIVSYGSRVTANKSDLTDLCDHAHEEADTQIPLHVLDIVQKDPKNIVEVWSPDTDVLLLLMDLAASIEGKFCTLSLLTGKGNKYRTIDIFERVKSKCFG